MKTSGTLNLALLDDDLQAFSIIMAIVHAQNSKLPAKTTDETLVMNLVRTVDKYLMQGCIGRLSDFWGPEEYEVNFGLHSFNELVIAWVFRKRRALTKVIAKCPRLEDFTSPKARELLESLPILQSIIGKPCLIKGGGSC